MRALQHFQRLARSALASSQPEALARPLMGTGACRLADWRGVSSSRTQGQADPAPQDSEKAGGEEFDRYEAVFSQMNDELAQKAGREGNGGLMGRPVDLEQEFDRDDPECVDVNELYAEPAPIEPLGRCVDLETEFDRDDPECVDVEELYREPGPPEPLMNVELDSEFDLMRGHEDETENPSGTTAGNMPLEGRPKAGPESVGKYSSVDTKVDDMRKPPEDTA